jgi:hypothetical protein
VRRTSNSAAGAGGRGQAWLQPGRTYTLHMLRRLLEFANYLTDTSDLKLRGHPVAEAMHDPALDTQIEEIRADVMRR